MSKEEINEQDVIAAYQGGANMSDIAKKYGTYVNKISRILIRNGIEKKPAGEIQSQAIADGKKPHPTRGKKINNVTRMKISKTKGEQWKKLPDEVKEKFREKAKEQWENKPQAEVDSMRLKAFRALRLSGKEGSKVEKFLVQSLKNAGYSVEFHRQNILSREKMEVDLFIPELGIAIEIDGPTHQQAIFGEEYLQKRQKADHIKNALIVSKGFVVIRVIMHEPKSTLYYSQAVADAVLAKLKELAEIRNRERKPQVWEVIVNG